MDARDEKAETGLTVPVDLADKAYDVADSFSHLYGCDEDVRTKLTDAIGMALAQERESCAFTAETHSGFGDDASIEAIAAMIRERGDKSPPWVDCVHLSPERYRELLGIETPPIDFTVDPFESNYRNWRGEVEMRWIIPQRVFRGSTEWHPEPQWLLRAYDVNRKAERDFALKDFLPGAPVAPEWAPVLEYRWYYADAEDAEYYPGWEATREDALSAGEGYYAGDQTEELNEETGRWELSFVLIEGAREPLRLSSYLSLEAIIEVAEDAVLEGEQVTEDDEGPFFEATPAQEADLERRIKAACDEWQIANGIFPMTRVVTAVRTFETVKIDVTEKRLAADTAKAGEAAGMPS